VGRVSTWAIRRPLVAVLVWVIALVSVGFLATTFKGTFNDSFSLPNTQSALAQDFLIDVSPKNANTNSANVVWSPTSGTVNDKSVKSEVDALLTKVATVEGVKCITSPYDKTYGPDCPKKEPVSVPFPPGTPEDFQKEVNDAFANGTTDVTYPEGTPADVENQLNDLLNANAAAMEATSTRWVPSSSCAGVASRRRLRLRANGAGRCSPRPSCRRTSWDGVESASSSMTCAYCTLIGATGACMTWSSNTARWARGT